jgi:DNA-binding NarL/FixJ family response regulator
MLMLKILVVEDYAPFRRFICSALNQRPEFRVVEAADGLEGVQKAEALQPDFILLDLNLPTLHGFEAARRIRRFAPEARLLFVSQESSADVVRESFRVGGDGYVQKMRAAIDLLPAIDAVGRGQHFVSSGLALSSRAAAHVSHRHEIAFCSDDQATVDTLIRFMAAALNAADAAIVLVTDSHRRRLLQELRMRGLDTEGAIQRGTCIFLDADEAPDLSRFHDVVNSVRAAAVTAGKDNARVAICGERAGRLWAAGRVDEALELERICVDFSEDVDVLCVYPRPHGEEDEQVFHLVCAEHTAVFSGHGQ